MMKISFNNCLEFAKQSFGVNDIKHTIQHYHNKNYSEMRTSGRKSAVKLTLTALATSGLIYCMYQLTQGPAKIDKLQNFKDLLSEDLSASHMKARLIAEECLSVNEKNCNEIVTQTLPLLINKTYHQALLFASTCLGNPTEACQIVNKQALDLLVKERGELNYASRCLQSSLSSLPVCKEINSLAWSYFIQDFEKFDENSPGQIKYCARTGDEYIKNCFKSTSEECEKAIDVEAFYDLVNRKMKLIND